MTVLFMGSAFAAIALMCWCLLCAVAARKNGYVRKSRLYLWAAFTAGGAGLILHALAIQEGGLSSSLWALVIMEIVVVAVFALTGAIYLRAKYRGSR